MVPPNVVLAAVDFSDGSRVALSFAARLAAQTGAALHVLHAQDPLLDAAARARGVDLAREAAAELQTFIRSVVTAVDRHVAQHVIIGAPVDVIRDIALRESAEVIVVGATGMSGAERAIFGSTTEGVLRKADTSVVVVPASWTPPHVDATGLSGSGPVIAAIDFSCPAMSAARAAWTLARTLGTSLEALHVVPALPVPQRWSQHAEAAVRQRAESARKDLGIALHALGDEVAMTLTVQIGRVAESLAAAARPSAIRHPILVLGRRSHRERGGAPGSTAYRVLTLSEVPVLLYLPRESSTD